MNKTKKRIDRAQALYKMTYNAGLRKQSEVIRKDDYVHLRVERKNPKYHGQKIEHVADGPSN